MPSHMWFRAVLRSAHSWIVLTVVLASLSVSQSALGAPAGPGAASADADLRMVLVLSRHGVRSPTHPAELQEYAALPWPTWNTPPGHLTEHGAALMRQFGAYYRNRFKTVPSLAGGCPARGSVFVWADVDERTVATGQAILDGFAPKCGITVGHATGKVDPLFDPVPGIGNVDAARSKAALLGTLGGDPTALSQAYKNELTSLEGVLGCDGAHPCKSIGAVPSVVTADGDGGLADLGGGIDLAAGAVSDLFLEYVDGHADVGWGKVDHDRLVDLLKIRTLKAKLVHGNSYIARVHSSNILAQIAATLSQASSGRKNASFPVPVGSSAVFIVGHDTQLTEIAGILGLSWLVPGYQMNDAPPGGALVFEVYAPRTTTREPYVRVSFAAESMEAMRAGDGTHPASAPVYVPGCPSLDCPISTFAHIVDASIDRSFVATSR